MVPWQSAVVLLQMAPSARMGDRVADPTASIVLAQGVAELRQGVGPLARPAELADALLRFRPRRREEAVTMLESLVAEPPRTAFTLQDGHTLTDAGRLLTRARKRR